MTRSMDHLRGPSPRTSSWTQSMDYSRGPPFIFEAESLAARGLNEILEP